jgi:hypothetical protein
MDATRFIHRHILLPDTSTPEKFTNPQGGGGKKLKLPLRDRHKHRNLLLSQLDKASQDLAQLKTRRKATGIDQKVGITLTFQSEPNFDLKFESLEFRRSGIELLSVQEREGITYASVFIPDGKLNYFSKKIEKYGSEETPKRKPKNQPLVESISEIHRTKLDDLWTDDKDLFPKRGEKIWWEVWLKTEEHKEPGENKEDKILKFFRDNANTMGLKLSKEYIGFPDRTVILAYGSPDQMAQSLDLLNCLAELRKAKENPELFMQMSPKEQREWVEEALERIEPASSDRVAICILDTGITKEHPLIKPHLSENDMHTYGINWIKSDQHGHGTEMAGMALYGELTEFLSSNNRVNIPYRLESSKIMPPNVENDPKLYGEIISQCISLAEIEAPDRQRIISMAITAPDNRDRGQPSSWSSKIDSICSGAEDEISRLMIVSAGNTDPKQRHNYPDSNFTDGIHDPAQAWNSLCVGAYTEKSIIDPNEYPGWKPIARPGQLSPSSTTSIIWEDKWPIKPDIVFEGGNNAIDPLTGFADSHPDSLQLLTTHCHPIERLFAVSGDTSAASSQVARMAAIIQAEYPEFWPETIRALLVHSAEWTSAMKAQWEPLHKKDNIKNLLRYCGFGVPNLTRALRSANNALTLIIQNQLYPYKKKENRCITRDMHIHQIPWPIEVLEDLRETDVEMRVTLSYFIEPNPARRGWEKRYGYASHQLRFDVKTPTEKLEQFRKRINKAARDEEEKAETRSDSREWKLGPILRHKGSIHSDRWQGSAIELARRSYIGVYPVSGWWKERHQLERWKREARYSMIVSITTPRTDVDIYTPVANEVGIKIHV